jgi:hypothetical protein
LALLQKDINKVTIDASRVYWISPFTACWFAALHDELAAIGRKYELVPPSRKNAMHQFTGLGIAKYLNSAASLRKSRSFSTFPVTKLT